MASPVVDGDVTISIKDELVSAPYVALTIGLMKKFGVAVDIEGDMDGGTPSFTIPETQKYVSPDRSAWYFLAGATITGGTVTVRECGSESTWPLPMSWNKWSHRNVGSRQYYRYARTRHQSKGRRCRLW